MAMNCPRCVAVGLLERERDGVTLDVCQSCRGMWLDRGELEKLIARATSEHDERDDHAPASSRRGYASSSSQQPRRKRSWLENLGGIFD